MILFSMYQSTIFQLYWDGSSWADVSHSRTQHSDASDALTRNLSVSSQALYHSATALLMLNTQACMHGGTMTNKSAAGMQHTPPRDIFNAKKIILKQGL